VGGNKQRSCMQCSVIADANAAAFGLCENQCAFSFANRLIVYCPEAAQLLWKELM
jgi:hypothetical protein